MKVTIKNQHDTWLIYEKFQDGRKTLFSLVPFMDMKKKILAAMAQWVDCLPGLTLWAATLIDPSFKSHQCLLTGCQESCRCCTRGGSHGTCMPLPSANKAAYLWNPDETSLPEVQNMSISAPYKGLISSKNFLKNNILYKKYTYLTNAT